MKSAYYKSRVVHVIDDKNFIVQVKEGFFSPWRNYSNYSYFSPHSNEASAKENAVALANQLVSSVVIHTGINVGGA